MPTTFSTRPNCTPSPAHSRSHASASSSPAVRHRPWATQSVGSGSSSIACVSGEQALGERGGRLGVEPFEDVDVDAGGEHVAVGAHEQGARPLGGRSRDAVLDVGDQLRPPEIQGRPVDDDLGDVAVERRRGRGAWRGFCAMPRARPQWPAVVGAASVSRGAGVSASGAPVQAHALAALVRLERAERQLRAGLALRDAHREREVLELARGDAVALGLLRRPHDAGVALVDREAAEIDGRVELLLVDAGLPARAPSGRRGSRTRRAGAGRP